LGWPIDKIPAEAAQKVLEGSRAICAEAGITLAGGHSIDCPEPVFGLAVNGIVAIANLKKNSTATAGCKLYLTKALGVGVLSTAQKRGVLKAGHGLIALQSMCKLNKIGETMGRLPEVKAMTDVTGFGLLGHLTEMCEGSKLQAVLAYEKVPKIEGIEKYLEQGCMPGGTNRNWASYGHKIGPLTETQRYILADPQTSGGLLIAVDTDDVAAFENVLKDNGVDEDCVVAVGWLEEQSGGVLVRLV